MSDGDRADKWYYSFLPMGIAGGMTSPLIALFAAQVLGASVLEVGFIASLTSIASVPAFVLWGHLSDSLGKRKVFVMTSFLGMALSMLLMATSAGLFQYYAANVLFGILTAASGPVSIVLILETAKRDLWTQRIASFSRIGALGWVAGLMIGAIWLQLVSLNLEPARAMQGLFIIATSLAMLSSLLAWRWLWEPEVKVKRRDMKLEAHLMISERARFLPLRVLHVLNPFNHGRNNLHRARRAIPRDLWLYFVAVGLFFGGFAAFYAVFPIFLLRVPKLSSGYIFIVYIASQVTSASLYSRVGHWVRDLGGRRMQLFATAGRMVLFPSFFAAALIPLSFEMIVLLIVGLHALVGLCWAVINVSGSTIVSKFSPAETRGEAQGIYNAIQGIGAIVGPLVGGVIAQFYSFFYAFLAASLFILGGIVVLGLSRFKEE